MGTLSCKNNECPLDKPTTQQSHTNKLAKGTIKFSEVEETADVLDHDIVLQERAK